MERFNVVNPKEINENFIELIGDKYALITVSDGGKTNMMTASWGSFGVMWNKNVVSIVVRPSRYTYGFLTKNPKFALNFLPSKYKDIYTFCGTKSGKNSDKVKETGVLPIKIDDYSVAFEESEYTFVCNTIYRQDMDKRLFVDKEFGDKMYTNEDVHTMFIAEIEKVFVKKH